MEGSIGLGMVKGTGPDMTDDCDGGEFRSRVEFAGEFVAGRDCWIGRGDGFDGALFGPERHGGEVEELDVRVSCVVVEWDVYCMIRV